MNCSQILARFGKQLDGTRGVFLSTNPAICFTVNRAKSVASTPPLFLVHGAVHVGERVLWLHHTPVEWAVKKITHKKNEMTIGTTGMEDVVVFSFQQARIELCPVFAMEIPMQTYRTIVVQYAATPGGNLMLQRATVSATEALYVIRGPRYTDPEPTPNKNESFIEDMVLSYLPETPM
jgi:hypothetical protein